jgi:hypothetical protein
MKAGLTKINSSMTIGSHCNMQTAANEMMGDWAFITPSTL